MFSMFPQLVYAIYSAAQTVLALRYAPGAEHHEDVA